MIFFGMNIKRPILLPALCLLGALVLIGCLAQCQTGREPSSQVESALDRVKRTGELRIGYGGYPPYLVKSGVPGEVSGYSVDLIERLLEIWNRDIEIIWVETSWDRVKADFLAGKFDLVVEPLFRTIARASELNFTRPYTYSGYGVAIVRAGDDRFSELDDFNDVGVRIAVNQSVSSHSFVEDRLPSATLRVLPTGNLEQPMMEVLLGQSDAAFVDVASARRFLDAQPGVAALFYDDPPIQIGAGFMLPQGDYQWESFLSTSIDYMETSGELSRLAEPYDIPIYRAVIERVDP